jgi:hypothetical protein
MFKLLDSLNYTNNIGRIHMWARAFAYIQQCSNLGLLFRPPWMEIEDSKLAASTQQYKAILNEQREY